MKLNKDLVYIIIIIGLTAVSAQFYYSFHLIPPNQALPTKNVEIYYNRDTQANQQIINQIQQADKFVYFAIYTFTRTDIKDALLGAKYRGLEVKGVLDKKQSTEIDAQTKIVKELRSAKIPVAFQTHSAIMHMKTVVTDKSYASGSYNWTASATDKNDEVLEVGTDDSIRKQYLKVIKELFKNYPPQ